MAPGGLKLHLVRLAQSQGEASFPGVQGFQALLLTTAQEIAEERIYVLLTGEVVIDLPEEYLHLKPGESAHLWLPHRLVPIQPSVIVAYQFPGTTSV